MRDWIEPRCLIVIGVLAAAPLAVLVQVLAWQLPALQAEHWHSTGLAVEQRRLDATVAQTRALCDRDAQLRRIAAQASSAQPDHWLPERRRDFVFDALAAAVEQPGVGVNAIQARPPIAYPGGSHDRLLAAERFVLELRGDYAALTRALDALAAIDLPLRITSVHWRMVNDGLALTLDVETAFVPDPELRAALADAAGWKEPDPDEE